ncbi:MAG: hypothetical protein U0353_27435 [Sandaracinus sp.]
MAEAGRHETEMVARLAKMQQSMLVPEPAAATAANEQAADAEPLDLDEASTRRIINEHLRAPGWEADTTTLRLPRRGARGAALTCHSRA